jgi:hypothetical protein
MHNTYIRLLTLLYHLKFVLKIVGIPRENSPQQIGPFYTVGICSTHGWS